MADALVTLRRCPSQPLHTEVKQQRTGVRPHCEARRCLLIPCGSCSTRPLVILLGLLLCVLSTLAAAQHQSLGGAPGSHVAGPDWSTTLHWARRHLLESAQGAGQSQPGADIAALGGAAADPAAPLWASPLGLPCGGSWQEEFSRMQAALLAPLPGLAERVLIYVCPVGAARLSDGDAVRGMLTALVAALMTERAFVVDCAALELLVRKPFSAQGALAVGPARSPLVRNPVGPCHMEPAPGGAGGELPAGAAAELLLLGMNLNDTRLEACMSTLEEVEAVVMTTNQDAYTWLVETAPASAAAAAAAEAAAGAAAGGAAAAGGVGGRWGMRLRHLGLKPPLISGCLLEFLLRPEFLRQVLQTS